MNPTLPQAPTKPVRELLHGVEVEDRFRWLEEQDSPATRDFIREQQKAYRDYLGAHVELRASIEARVRQLLTVDTVDLPVPDGRGGLLYLKRRAKEQQKAIYRCDRSGEEICLLSGETFGGDSHTSFAIVQVSSDGRYLAFATRTGGEDVQKIGIYDLALRRMLPDRLPRGFHRGLVFDRAGTGFYYAHEELEGKTQHRRSVKRHIFGQERSRDDEIFCGGEDPSLRLLLQGDEEGSMLGYLILSLDTESRIRFLVHRLPLHRPPDELVELREDRFAARFVKGAILALTSYGAPRGRIVSISQKRTAPDAWVDVVPEEGRRLCAFEPYDSGLLAHYLDGPIRTTRLYSESGGLLREIHYPANGTITVGRVDACHGRLFYAHSDIALPTAIHAVELTTGEAVPWWQQAAYLFEARPEIQNRTYVAQDGASIPITLIHPRGSHGFRPALLSAYGGGGVSNTPKYSVLVTVLIEAGFSCVTAHARGGGEGGTAWHRAALKRRKQISVDDLVAAAEWLIENRYTTPEQLAIAGQSHGALLTLCAITQKPHLFRAAMALGPIADLTRFHLFGVARGFVAELGSPDDPQDFTSLYQLSPYHGIRAEISYPAVLVVSGDRDKRCDALHARKMIARLRETARQQHPILLDYTEHRGHKPVLPLEERIQSLSDRLTFLIAELTLFPNRERAS